MSDIITLNLGYKFPIQVESCNRLALYQVWCFRQQLFLFQCSKELFGVVRGSVFVGARFVFVPVGKSVYDYVVVELGRQAFQ